MSAKNKAKAHDSGVNEQQAKTRLLLALSDMGATKTEVMKGQLTKRVVQKSHKASDYQGIFDELEKEGVISSDKNKFSLSSQGVARLGECLKNPELQFEETIVGTWVANALSLTIYFLFIARGLRNLLFSDRFQLGYPDRFNSSKLALQPTRYAGVQKH